MDDITPLNLEDQPKLFGLRYDQLISILGSLIVSTQLYSWLNPIPFWGQDLRLDVAIFIALIGPIYSVFTLNQSSDKWELILNFYLLPQKFMPGPDPSTLRFLIDEELPLFTE